MSDLRNVLERAERAVASVPLPPDGFEALKRYRRRRHLRNRMMAGAVALLVAAGGTLGSVALLRAMRHVTHQQPGATTSSSPSVTPSVLPVGTIPQGTIDGGPAQLLGPFWFGLMQDNSCLRAGPLGIGPSWTLEDSGHDCVTPLGSALIRVGRAHGAVHRDGDLAPKTEFNAVYGLVTPAAVRVDMVWSTGGTASVAPVNGRFLLVWSGAAWPIRATAFSADGKKLATVTVTAP